MIDAPENDTQEGMSKALIIQALAALAFVQLVESISYMVVTPSLIFYVLQSGGTKEEYGWILSCFSFASFLAKPFLGAWVDASKNHFRIPYFTAIAIGAIGGLLYFGASFVAHNGIGWILTGRLMGGVGAGCQSLGYAYIAAVVPHGEQTSTNVILGLTRILGMALGPAFNLLLANIEVEFDVFANSYKLDALNSVGLFLAGMNGFAFLVVYFFLPEPSKAKLPEDDKEGFNKEQEASTTCQFLQKCLRLEIALPIFAMFVFNSSFQLIETALAPAASHALGWGPVQSSTVLGSTSVLVLINMMIVMYLSRKQIVAECTLIQIGSCCWIVGGTLLYFTWTPQTPTWLFVLPVFVCIGGFPFIIPANRAMYSRAVDDSFPTRQGSMQAILSMSASVAGFVTPGIVASYILCPVDSVDHYHRELTPGALYMAILPLFVLVGLACMRHQEIQSRDYSEAMLNESSPLLSIKDQQQQAREEEIRRASFTMV